MWGVKFATKIKSTPAPKFGAVVKDESEKRSLKTLLISDKPYAKSEPRVKKLDAAVVKFIVGKHQPLSLVDDPLFVEMLAEFDNRYRLMCRQTLTNTLIFNAYNKVTERIKQICYNVAHFGSSADAWTSDTGEPFLAFF
jgi:hypothetical protein